MRIFKSVNKNFGLRMTLSFLSLILWVSGLAYAGKVQDPFLQEAVKKYGSQEEASKAIQGLAWSYLNQGYWEIAAKRFEQAKELEPENPDIFWGLGAASSFQQKWNEAIDFFKQGLKLNPDHPNLLADLSWAYEEKGVLEEATTWNQKAKEAFAKINPPHKNRWKPSYNSGLIYAKKGQLENAVSALKEAIQINPQLGDAYGLLAIVYYERRQFDLAAQNAQKATELGFQMDEEFLEALKAHQ